MQLHPPFHRLFTFLVGVLFIQSASGQIATHEKVFEMKPQTSGIIRQGEEVKGYYFFYQEDKVAPKQIQYRLRVLDENLANVTDESFVGPKSLRLEEGTFNGTDLMFKFTDDEAYKYLFRVYGNNGKLIKQLEKVTTKKDSERANLVKSFAGGFETTLCPIGKVGFVHIMVVDQPQVGFEIQFFPKDRDFQGWTYRTDPASKMTETAQFICADEKQVLLQVLKRKSFLSSEIDAYLLGIDLATGKKKFEVLLRDSNNSFFLLNGFKDKTTGNCLLFGNFTAIGDHSLKDNILGLVGLQVDANGKFVYCRKVSWEQDVAKFLPVDYKGKIEEIGYVHFHKILQTADGKIYAIGEQYRKALAPGGLAVSVLTGGQGASDFKMIIQNLMVFEFDTEFKISGIHEIEKQPTEVRLPTSTGVSGPTLLGYWLNYYGGFDYRYAHTTHDGSAFTVCMTSLEGEQGVKEKKGNWVFKTVNHSANGYTSDKIDLKTESTTVDVMEAKAGYLLIYEYDEVLKKVDLRLEKIND